MCNLYLNVEEDGGLGDDLGLLSLLLGVGLQALSSRSIIKVYILFHYLRESLGFLKNIEYKYLLEFVQIHLSSFIIVGFATEIKILSSFMNVLKHKNRNIDPSYGSGPF